MAKLPKIIIMGRTNVGKSTLFNRLIGRGKALTSKIAGTTRDLNIGEVEWRGINFELIDTGGIETILPGQKVKKLSPEANKDFAIDIIKKTQSALKQADLILFTVDLQAGLMVADRELAKALKKYAKKIIFVANKADSLKLFPNVAEFYKLGLGEPVLVSGLNGAGTGDLLDVVIAELKKMKKTIGQPKVTPAQALKITIIGKPNVGKSSLLNAILGEDRVIVSPIPFTTREAIDTYLEYKGKKIILVDTAGIRKQAKIAPGLEKISVRKSLSNARQADVCLLVLDISKPLTVQDNKLSKILIDAKVSLIIVANKWDAIEGKKTNTPNEFSEYIYQIFPYLTWAPIIFISALTGKNVHNVLNLALQVYEARQTQIDQTALDEFWQLAVKKRKPIKAKGQKFPCIQALTQVKTNPPQFEVRIGPRDTLSQAYLKYLENSLRRHFKLIGTPIQIKIKQ
jgi:GTP-binding protein